MNEPERKLVNEKDNGLLRSYRIFGTWVDKHSAQVLVATTAALAVLYFSAAAPWFNRLIDWLATGHHFLFKSPWI